MNIDIYFTPYTNINLKVSTDLNVKGTVIKLLEENTRKNRKKKDYFCNFKVGKNFLNSVQIVQTIKIKLNFLSTFKMFVFFKGDC